MIAKLWSGNNVYSSYENAHFRDSIATDASSSDEDWLILKLIVTEDKVKRAILDFMPFKSPELDGV